MYKQEIESPGKLNEDDLSDFYRQEPNRKIPLLPIAPFVWLYQTGQNYYDKEELNQEKQETIARYNEKIEEADKEKKVNRLESKKQKKVTKIDRKLEEGNLLMRWGEPVSVYDSTLAGTTRQQMENYLHTKGFFNGHVEHDISLEGQRLTSNYTIEEQIPYIIDTITYQAQDSIINSLLDITYEERLVKKGQIYDEANLSKERERIETLLRNNGFYDFSRQYIEYRVDSTLEDQKVVISTIIREPAKRGYHKRFKLDSVIFTTDADLKNQQVMGERKSSAYNNITYRYYEYKYYKKILDRRLFIYPDSLYSLEETLQTQRQLSNLDVFKFININYDTTGNNFIARVYASPLKKYQTSNEIGLNVSQGLPGPFINSSLKIRNVFGGLEILELSGRAGIEGVPPPTGSEGQQDAYRSVEAGGNLSLTFPQFVFPLTDKLKSRLGALNPRTRLQTGYNYTDRREYVRTNFNTALSYTWQELQRVNYTFTPLDINLIDSRNLSDSFLDLLSAQDSLGIPLSRSFQPSFVSSISFTTIFNFGNYGDFTDESSSAYLRLFVESGGTIFNLINPDIITDNGLEVFKFFKINTDFRQNIPISRSTSLAYRVNVGVAVPYGDTTGNVLPYEKYYFAGGSNSIRAWRPRRLGPGGAPPETTDSDGYYVYNVEQPGEVLLEASVELRRNLFGFVNGAFFVDAGNIWRLYESASRPEANFEFNSFYRQIAVGSGLGLRLDFSFLIVRFDYGVKVYDPARENGRRWIGQKFSWGEEVSRGIFNIGIGYPF